MFKKLLLASAVVAVSTTAFANLTFKAGMGYLDPTSTKDVGSAVKKAEISGEAAILPSFDYRFGNSPVSAELLLATPFEHKVKSEGKEVAEFKHLPPTVTVKYNTPSYNGLSANVGVGATVLVPYDEKFLAGEGKLEAKTKVAPAAQVGVNYTPVSSPWGVFADVRYVDLKTDLELNGSKIGSLEVNPVVYSLGVSHKF